MDTWNSMLEDPLVKEQIDNFHCSDLTRISMPKDPIIEDARIISWVWTLGIQCRRILSSKTQIDNFHCSDLTCISMLKDLLVEDTRIFNSILTPFTTQTRLRFGNPSLVRVLKVVYIELRILVSWTRWSSGIQFRVSIFLMDQRLFKVTGVTLVSTRVTLSWFKDVLRSPASL